jgi:hypothetical protein
MLVNAAGKARRSAMTTLGRNVYERQPLRIGGSRRRSMNVCNPCVVNMMTMSRIDPEGSSQSSPLAEERSTEALLSALKLASWQGLEMWVQDVDGTNYRINAPVIIGSDFVQFATGSGLRAVAVPLSDIMSFELP